ncbi:hypothetical protein BVY01_00185 [bacterium I07]|nr:hypothetical protein BVY01_00185 [bacterium I07]
MKRMCTTTTPERAYFVRQKIKKLAIHEYQTSRDLKSKIRTLVLRYNKIGWKLVQISIQGSELCLLFEPDSTQGMPGHD